MYRYGRNGIRAARRAAAARTTACYMSALARSPRRNFAEGVDLPAMVTLITSIVAAAGACAAVWQAKTHAKAAMEQANTHAKVALRRMETDERLAQRRHTMAFPWKELQQRMEDIEKALEMKKKLEVLQNKDKQGELSEEEKEEKRGLEDTLNVMYKLPEGGVGELLEANAEVEDFELTPSRVATFLWTVLSQSSRVIVLHGPSSSGKTTFLKNMPYVHSQFIKAYKELPKEQQASFREDYSLEEGQFVGEQKVVYKYISCSDLVAHSGWKEISEFGHTLGLGFLEKILELRRDTKSYLLIDDMDMSYPILKEFLMRAIDTANVPWKVIATVDNKGRAEEIDKLNGPRISVVYDADERVQASEVEKHGWKLTLEKTKLKELFDKAALPSKQAAKIAEKLPSNPAAVA